VEGRGSRLCGVVIGDTRPAETRNFERLGPVFQALTDMGVTARTRAVLRFPRPTRCESGFARPTACSCGSIRSVAARTAPGSTPCCGDVASRGVWVSAHPDTIAKMGTKEVLYRTQDLGWGTETHLYASMEQLQQQFPSRLGGASRGLLKQNRGNGGIGVWKVTLIDGPDYAASADPVNDAIVRVQHAAPRNDATED